MRPTVITLALEMIEMQSLVTIASKDILEDSTESVPVQMVTYAQHDSMAHMIVQQCFDTDNVIVEHFFKGQFDRDLQFQIVFIFLDTFNQYLHKCEVSHRQTYRHRSKPGELSQIGTHWSQHIGI